MDALILLLTAGLAATAGALANWLALIPWRRSVGAPWTERARLLWPARTGAGWNLVAAGLLAAGVVECVWAQDAPVWYARTLAGIGGALAGSYFFDRELFPEFTGREWLRQMLAGWGLHIALGAVLIAGLVYMPDEINPRALTIAAAVLVGQLAIRLKLAALVLRSLGVLQPADPALKELVRSMSTRVGTPVAGVWRLSGPQAQAYALPLTGELWFSGRLLEICTEAEIRAIAAHEIAHLTESRLTVAGRVAAAMVWWPLVFLNPAMASFGLPGFAGLVVLCLTLSRSARWASFRLERRADEMAASAQEQDGDYASGLEKLYRENQLPAVNPKGQHTHPSLYDRLTDAGRVPD
ncbi:MAG: M48 family metallopeptidase, partial [Limisphaerales bacterium]